MLLLDPLFLFIEHGVAARDIDDMGWLTMDGSPPKTNRKVRFSLPEPAVPAVPSTTPVQKQRMAHGTMQYVNGTLISQSQQTAPSAQARAHQSLQITPTPTSATVSIGSSTIYKPKELNNKIVLHLRPSVNSLDSGSELSSPKGSPGASTDGKPPRQKSYLQKSGSGNGCSTTGAGTGGSGRSLKTLPQINQKFPSSEDVNNNVGGANRTRPSDDLGPIAGGLWNHPTKKPTIMLRTISSSGAQTHPSKAPIVARTRTKSVGKLQTSVGAGGRHTKSLISPHLAPMDGMMVRVQENSTTVKSGDATGANESKDRRVEELNVSSIIRQNGTSNGSNHRSMYGKSGQYLAVPEYTDRYEGMETAVSATLNDEEEDEFEDSEQDGSRTGHADEQNGTPNEPASNGNDLLKSVVGDDGKFRCARETNLGRDRNTAQFWDFVERWRTNRALKKLESANHEPSAPVSTTVLIGSERTKTDTKSPTLSSRIRALRMSLEQVPTVTTLLRASRDANEYLLKEVFRDILENGISKENLNSTDRSGRVSTVFDILILKNLPKF
uniref:Uncharacterized protein n=1 Tax=Anopheles culicifacies TaxID=139723 RepID=A0A182LS93_9DIPT